jgi:hypothetical protein
MRQYNGQKKKDKRDKQRSTKHTHKTKDGVTRTPLKTGMNSALRLVAIIDIAEILLKVALNIKNQIKSIKSSSIYGF